MDLSAVLAEAEADAASAPWDFREGRTVFEHIAPGRDYELLTDVWAFDDSLAFVLLVQHPRRGWVMPGGGVEPGETIRAGAVRELREETGVELQPRDLTAAAVNGGFLPDRNLVKISLSFSAVVPTDAVLVGERGQPPQWWSLEEVWESVYPHDRSRLLAHRDLLRRAGSSG